LLLVVYAYYTICIGVVVSVSYQVVPMNKAISDTSRFFSKANVISLYGRSGFSERLRRAHRLPSPVSIVGGQILNRDYIFDMTKIPVPTIDQTARASAHNAQLAADRKSYEPRSIFPTSAPRSNPTSFIPAN
jgi:hypothetical protein